MTLVGCRARLVSLGCICGMLLACGGGSGTDDATSPDEVPTGPDEVTSSPVTTPDGTATASGSPTAGVTTAPAEPVGSMELAIFEGAGIHVPEYAADRLGFFEDHGVEVTLTPVSGGAGVHMSSLVSGSVDAAANQASLVANAVGQGTDVRYFCGQVGTQWNVLLTPNDSDIPTFEEAGSWEEVIASLEGKTFGVDVPAGPQESQMSALLRDAGVDPEQVEFVVIGTVGEAMVAIERGVVDAAFGYPFITQQLVGEGRARQVLDIAANGPPPRFHTGYFALLSWLEDNAETAHAFCDAIGDATAHLQDPANSADLDALLQEVFGVESEAAREQVFPPDGLISLYGPELDCDRIEVALEDAQAAGVIGEESPTDCESVVWDQASP